MPTFCANVGGTQVAAVVALRLDRIQLDRAAFGVAARQGSLGTAQDLHPIQIEKVEVGARQAGVVHIIDVDADPGFQGRIEIGLANPADEGRHAGTERASRFFANDV
jgi:hypothetical protein